MKYKRIAGALRNFAQSFTSVTNWVGDVCIADILGDVVVGLPDARLEIHFPGGALVPAGDYPAPLCASVARFAGRFAEHLAKEGVDARAVRAARIILCVDRLGLYCDVAATDDRGVEHKANVL